MKKPRTARVIRGRAKQLLTDYEITRPPVPVAALADALGIRVRYSPFDGELAGMLARGDDETIIGVNSLHHPNRQRFTIAHELGHFCLLHKGEVHIDRTFRINRRDAASSQAVNPDEIEANRFAAELLMPYDMIVDDLLERDIDVENEEQIKELAEIYKVSAQAMTHRLTNILQLYG